MSTTTDARTDSPTVSLVKDYAAPFTQWAVETHRLRVAADRRAARHAVARTAVRYSRLVTEWDRTGLQPAELADVRDLVALAEYLAS